MPVLTGGLGHREYMGCLYRDNCADFTWGPCDRWDRDRGGRQSVSISILSSDCSFDSCCDIHCCPCMMGGLLSASVSDTYPHRGRLKYPAV